MTRETDLNRNRLSYNMAQDLDIKEKVTIAASFLLDSPPGEVNDVFNGMPLYLVPLRVLGAETTLE